MTHPDLSGPAGKPGLFLSPTLTTRRKRREDTPAGCRELAAADLARADALDGDHVQWRYRHSAGAWLARAELLDRLEAKFQERMSSTGPLAVVEPAGSDRA